MVHERITRKRVDQHKGYHLTSPTNFKRRCDQGRAVNPKEDCRPSNFRLLPPTDLKPVPFTTPPKMSPFLTVRPNPWEEPINSEPIQ